MDIEMLKKYLQNYLDTVSNPKINKIQDEMGFPAVKFKIIKISKVKDGDDIYHIYLGSEPELLKMHLKGTWVDIYSEVRKDVKDFLQMLSIDLTQVYLVK